MMMDDGESFILIYLGIEGSPVSARIEHQHPLSRLGSRGIECDKNEDWQGMGFVIDAMFLLCSCFNPWLFRIFPCSEVRNWIGARFLTEVSGWVWCLLWHDDAE